MADPRDPGTLEPPASSFPLHHRRSLHFSSPSQPRLPQSQFSFEYRLPLRKRALTASATAQHYHQQQHQQSSAAAAPEPRRTTTTTTSTPTPTTDLEDHRRSVPNFSLPHIASLSLPEQQQPLPPWSINRKNLRPREVDSTPGHHNALSPNASKRPRQSAPISLQTSRPLAKDTMPSSTLSYSYGRSSFGPDKTRALNGVGKQSREPQETTSSPNADDARSRNEDLFLNIARSDSDRRDSFARSEFRRSRFGLSGSNSLRSPTSRVNNNETTTPSPEQLRFTSPNPPLRSNHTSYGSVSHLNSSASAHPLEDQGRSRYAPTVGPSSRSTIGLPRSRLSRTSPDASPQGPPTSAVERRPSLQDSRVYGNSSLSTIRSSRQGSSEATERVRAEPEKTRQDGTESTLSTNAPSTVWDELEDLKSRIRKLELTGKLPPSSQAAMSASGSGERPRTAATTATTLSSSPKHNRKASFPSPNSDPVVNQIHPILQTALAKTKGVLSNEVYRALEATVNDATALSNVLGSSSVMPSSSASVANGYSPSDRQSRRKADSVCRGLTELCLALSDEQLRQQRPSSQDDTIKVQPNGTEEPSTPVLPFQRSASFEPEGIVRRRSTTRVGSRLEARRASLINSSPGNITQDDPPPPVPDRHSIQQPQSHPHPQPQPQPQSNPAPKTRLSRMSTSASTRPRRLQEDETDRGTTHGRTLSRAMTDIVTPVSNRVTTRQRFSHGYMPSQDFTPQTPQQQQQPQPQPPPQQQKEPSHPRTPSVSQSGIPLRRNFVAPANFTPATSRANIQAGSRRYGLPGFSSDTPGNAPDMPESPQATPSHNTRLVAPSTKLAASYTPVQQNRTRTNSLGTRRFGVRPRPMVNVDNNTTINDNHG